LALVGGNFLGNSWVTPGWSRSNVQILRSDLKGTLRRLGPITRRLAGPPPSPHQGAPSSRFAGRYARL